MTPTQHQALPPISFSRVAAFATVLALFVAFIILAKGVLLPLVFGSIFALTLRPICNWVERYVHYPALAIIITFVIAVLPVAVAILLFSFQTLSVIDDLPTITEEFQESIDRMVSSVARYMGVRIQTSGYEWASEQFGDALDEPFVYIRSIVTSGAGVIGMLALSSLYAFLLLLYRAPLYHFALGQFSSEQRASMESVFEDTQRMSYKYLTGLGTVMLILGVLNSSGLMIIGIEYAFFWGFLAAFLAVIPYIGTFIGGALPFLYALSTTDTTWQPIAVVALFLTIQTIEGNIITPKVVGSSIQINPLAAILALFVGGFIWGVEGLILALPLVAILRIFMIHTDRFRAFGLLMSDDLVQREVEFLSLLDQPHYRLINLFRAQPREVISAKAELHTRRKTTAADTHGPIVTDEHGRRKDWPVSDEATDVEVELTMEGDDEDQMLV